MAVRQPVQKLPHYACIHFFCELAKIGVQKTHQIVVHEIKDQIERT